MALTGEPNYRVARIPVFSALNIAKWRELLPHYPDNVICDFLEFGWPIGYMSDTLPIFHLRTHRGALTFPDQVNAYLSKEVQLGRIAGPFDKAPFMQGFVLSPLNTVEKRDSEERRVIVDLSWPSGHSVNDGIPSDSYLGAPLSLRYPTIDDIVDAVVTLGRGCYLYKRDLRKAYRQFPVDPKDYPFLGYTWNKQFYFDTVLTMGLRSAAMACQRSTAAVAWVASQQGRVVFNYLDDFIGVSPAFNAQTNFQALSDLLSSLGLHESSEKACPPSPVMICLGVELNTDALTLSVSPGRLCELEQLLEQWIHKRTATKAALQSLVGKLIFISKCVRQSRIFIARILILLRKGLFNHHHVNLTAEFRKDIAWWRRFLRAYNGVSMISTAQWSSPGEVFTTDACLTGCGGLCGDQYFHAAFPSFVVQQTLDINCLELLTIIVALKLWGLRWSGLRLTVRCDNAVAVTVLNTGWCRNSFLNSCLRELCYLAAIHEFEIRAVHVPGVSNCYADILSRWDSNNLAGRTEFLAHAQHVNLQAVPVPDDMFQFDNDF